MLHKSLRSRGNGAGSFTSASEFELGFGVGWGRPLEKRRSDDAGGSPVSATLSSADDGGVCGGHN